MMCTVSHCAGIPHLFLPLVQPSPPAFETVAPRGVSDGFNSCSFDFVSCVFNV
jgi:hypothetical protein